MRKIGSVLVLDLVALRQGKDFKNFEKEQKYGMAIPKSGNAIQGTASTSRIYSRDRHHRRRQERAVRLCRRDRRTVARAVEAQVNPIEDGTELRNTATLQILKHWCTTHRDLQNEIGITSAQQGAAPGQQRWVSCAHRMGNASTIENSTNSRKIEDGVLLVVPARIFGHPIRALIDSGATRGFISVNAIKPLGLSTVKEQTFLELGDGQKILSRGKVLDIPVVTAGLTTKMDFTVTSLLHDVDLILGINWLQLVNPLIDWKLNRLFLPDAMGTTLLPSDWLDAQQHIGTVKVLSSAEQLTALQDTQVQSAVSVLRTPQFWDYCIDGNTRWCSNFKRGSKMNESKESGQKEKKVMDNCKLCSCKSDHHICNRICNLNILEEILEVKRLTNNAAIPKRSTEGAVGYDLSSAENITIPAHGRGVVKTGISVKIPRGMYVRIAPRSGLSVKKSIDIGAGVVDEDYRGEIGVVLINNGNQDFTVKQGDRIAQLILEKVSTPGVYEVQTLDETTRGAGGFGSTEVKSQTDENGKQLVQTTTNSKLQILRNATVSQRQFITPRQLKKILKRANEQCFLAVVRPVKEEENARQKGMTQKVKRELMKEKGAVRAAPPVEETRRKICSDAPEKIRDALSRMLQEYEDLFPEKLPKGRPPKRAVEFEINTVPEATPPSRPPYRLSPKESEELQAQIDDLLSQGHIRPSQSPYGAPVLFVPKKDGRWRMCVDYRALNKQTVKDRYPLPRIDDLIDRLGRARYFTTLDLASGYHQIAMKNADIHKTAFRTQRGQFEFLVMPFGVTNAPATFQRLMNTIFKDELDAFVSVYLDDILVFSETEEEHLQHVRVALERLREAKLFARLHKCEFFKSRVEYLGFDVSAQGVQPSPDKVKAVVEWPTPRNVKDVRSFLGLAGFYRRFVRGFSQKARPLTELTKDKTPWKWESAQEEAFNKLKESLISAPVLHMPDFNRPFVLTTDASLVAVGAILEQDFGNGLQPVAFDSRKLTSTEMRYSAYERELLGIVWAIGKWRHYFEGRPLIVQTDHSSLRHLPNQPSVNRRIWKWLSTLQGYDIEIRHIPGKINPADTLTRQHWAGDSKFISDVKDADKELVETIRVSSSATD